MTPARAQRLSLPSLSPPGELLPPAASSMPLPLPSLSALRAQIDPVDVQGGCWLSDPDAQLFLPPGRLGDALKTEAGSGQRWLGLQRLAGRAGGVSQLNAL